MNKRIPTGTIIPTQLMDDLLQRFPAWHGTPLGDGTFADPLLRVQWTPEMISIDFPDGTDVAAVDAVIAAYKPRPTADQARQARREVIRQKLATTGLQTLTPEELRELIP